MEKRKEETKLRLKLGTKIDLSERFVRFVRFAGLLDFSDYSDLSDLSISEFQKKRVIN